MILSTEIYVRILKCDRIYKIHFLYNKKKRMRNEKKEKDNSSNEMIEMFHRCLVFLANSDRMVASFFSSSFFFAMICI